VELPLIDEHAVEVDAPPARVWDALDGIGAGPGIPQVYARLIGCDDPTGFHVASSSPPSELVLEGRHRFSTYRLTFRVDDLGGARSRLRAESRATFPGAGGAVYRTLVIGTRAHVLMTRRLLDGIARRA
jgi:hypothetical protein